VLFRFLLVIPALVGLSIAVGLVITFQLLARHSREGGNPVPLLFCSFVFGARVSTRFSGERVPFFARAKKGTKETRPRTLRPSGFLPEGSATAR
jgi:hypothetical protein